MRFFTFLTSIGISDYFGVCCRNLCTLWTIITPSWNSMKEVFIRVWKIVDQYMENWCICPRDVRARVFMSSMMAMGGEPRSNTLDLVQDIHSTNIITF